MNKKVQSGVAKAVTLAMIAASTVGCAGLQETMKNNSKTAGAVIGAVLGGAGAALGKGDGKTIAIYSAAGAALGTGAGYLYQEKKEKELKEALAQREGMVVSITDEGNIRINATGKVLFGTAKHDLTPDAKDAIRDIAGILNSDAAAKEGLLLELEIEGHADSRGSEKYNQALSERRALAVKKELAKNGMNAADLHAVGKGELEPAFTNETAEGRANNRRVELELQVIDMIKQKTQ